MYRLTIIPAMEVSSKSISFEFGSKLELDNAKNNIADLLLFIQDDVKAMEDYSNVFICECFEDGEWQEIED